MIDCLWLQTPVELVSQPGDVLFHDLLCGHCGSTNTSPVPRLAVVGSFTAEDTR
jgi:ectoine hydroxylase-related dioxygenase (phytanoyl-CoA dioxygenase family)